MKGVLTRSEKEKTQQLCPLDRLAITNDFHIDLLAEKLLYSYPVYCTNRINDCMWEGPRFDLDSHRISCAKREVPKWLDKLRDRNKLNESNSNLFMMDDELAEKIEKEVPESDLIARVYFKNPEVVSSKHRIKTRTT